MDHWCYTPGHNDTDINAMILDQTIECIKDQVDVNNDFDLPYVAGYSLDGKKIYLDRHLPETMSTKGKTVELWKYVILHEAVEKSLLMHLSLHYQMAHQIALRAEQNAVENDGIDWESYNKGMQKFIKADSKEKLTRVPKDLDLQPYRDEHDTILLKYMIKAMKNG